MVKSTMEKTTPKKDLLHFLYEASKKIYVFSGEKPDNSVVKTKNDDGSTTVTYSLGDFSLNDNYFGGEPYGGREIVFYQDKPLWIMTYYGFVTKPELTTEIYSILFEALQKSTEESPFRGPKEYSRCSMKYSFDFDGEYDRFQGVERISQGDIVMYEAFFAGGLVDVN